MKTPPIFLEPPEFRVGLRPIALADWLRVGADPAWRAWKTALIAAHPALVTAAAPGAEAGALELAALLGAASLLEAAGAVPDDLCVLERREEGWMLAAAVVCAPTFWSLPEVIGKPLAFLHAPVPDVLGRGGAQGLAARIARVFDALAPDAPLERFNWTVQAGDDRFTPSSAPLLARAARTQPAAAADVLHLRVERQTVRKLPGAGAVAFTIGVSIELLAPLLRNGETRAAFAQAWRTAPARVRAYKNWDKLDRLVEAVLTG
ncbi:MAG: heme-dependent oxidative N-demethylase subunit alpha family protein [Hyphomonadaceae bacterium]